MSLPNLYLSSVQLDARQRAPRADLRDAVAMHRRVMSLFPDVGAVSPRSHFAVLHRLEPIGGSLRLLVQSEVEPDAGKLPPGYLNLRSVQLASLIGSFSAGDFVRYRIVANATKKVARGAVAGKRIALGADDTRGWWLRKADESGLDPLGEATLASDTFRGSRSDARVMIRPWRIDGVAKVIDPTRLRDAIACGIGRGRAYGCGLLSIARA